MLSYNEIKERKYIVMDGTPYEVVYSHVARKQANKPQNKTKLKNLISGGVIEHTFHVSDNAEEADMSRKKIEFIYSKGDELWFHNEGKPAERFPLNADIIGDKARFLSPKLIVDSMIYTDKDGNENIIGLQLPAKMEFEVVDAPPSIKGNTSGGGNKVVTLEGGATITVPLFINEGDVVRVNTDKGEYVERVSKA